MRKLRKRRIRLVSGLPISEVTNRLRSYARAGEANYRAVGFYLLELERRGGYRPGFSSAVDWAKVRLDMPPKLAQELLRTSRKLESRPGPHTGG